jgi:hypothetical protein
LIHVVEGEPGDVIVHVAARERADLIVLGTHGSHVVNRTLGTTVTKVLERATVPVVLHWLGTAFDPELEGYFGASDWQTASAVLLDIIAENPGKVAGVKMSLLNAESEISVRSRLPEGVRMFTGDDFNYVSLIGDSDAASASAPASAPAPAPASTARDLAEPTGSSREQAVHSAASGALAGNRTHSDALLGAFAAITPVASAAIQALDAGDDAAYRSILGPTEELSRQVFAAPTFYYKTGVAFLSWLNGHQPAFQMVGGLHSARSLPHLSRIVELANASLALENPELARERWHGMLRLNGLEA